MMNIQRGGVGSGVTLSNTNPQPLGTVTPGVGTGVSRDDHVHPVVSLSVSGTGGNGFIEAPNQASAPGTPTTAGRIFFDATNRLSWKGTNGFVRTFDGVANTADRVYTLPNASGVVVLDTFAQTLTNKTLTAPIIADLSNATHAHDSSAHGGVLAGAALGTTSTPQFARVGIGVAADAVIPLLVTVTSNPNSGGFTAIAVNATLRQTATSDFNNFAFAMTLLDSAAVTIVNNFTQAAIAGEFQVNSNHAGTFGTAESILAEIQIFGGAAGAITNLNGVLTKLTGVGANTTSITNYSALRVATPVLNGATLTNDYGIYVEDQNVGGTLNYALYTNRGDIRLMSNIADKFGMWGATPIAQPTTAFAAATFVANAGTAVNDASTFDGYTIKQVVKILRGLGALA